VLNSAAKDLATAPVAAQVPKDFSQDAAAVAA